MSLIRMLRRLRRWPGQRRKLRSLRRRDPFLYK